MSVCVCVSTILLDVYIYLENHKNNIFYPYGFGHYFCPLRFFPIRPCPAANPLLTGQSFPWNLGFVGQVPTVWVSRLETVFGAVCWHLLTVVFFQHDVKKILYSISLYFIDTSKFGGTYASICGQIWVLYRDSQFAPLSGWDSSFGDCQRMSEPGVVKGFEQPFKIKNKIHNSTKTTSVTGKTHNGQTKLSVRFSRYIYIYIANVQSTLKKIPCHSVWLRKNMVALAAPTFKPSGPRRKTTNFQGWYSQAENASFTITSFVFFIQTINHWEREMRSETPSTDSKGNGHPGIQKLATVWNMAHALMIYPLEIIISIANLVGGIPTPLKNMSSSVGMIIPFPTEWKVIKFHGSSHHQPETVTINFRRVVLDQALSPSSALGCPRSVPHRIWNQLHQPAHQNYKYLPATQNVPKCPKSPFSNRWKNPRHGSTILHDEKKNGDFRLLGDHWWLRSPQYPPIFGSASAPFSTREVAKGLLPLGESWGWEKCVTCRA